MVEHRDAARHQFDNRQVVADEQASEPVLTLQLGKEFQHPGLHRNIQRRGRLVGDQQSRLQRQRSRDAHPLPLPAGELMREAVSHVRGQLHLLQQRLDSAFPLGAIHSGVQGQRFGDRLADGPSWIQRRSGILEHHPHLAPDIPQLLTVGSRNILSGNTDSARGHLEQAHGGTPDSGFPGTRFADKAHHFASADREGHIVDSPEVAALSRILDDGMFHAQR